MATDWLLRTRYDSASQSVTILLVAEAPHFTHNEGAVVIGEFAVASLPAAADFVPAGPTEEVDPMTIELRALRKVLSHMISAADHDRPFRPAVETGNEC